ncbi:MAG: capsule biosynthesis protein CapI [Bacteroides sp. SM23_62_1]|nr:MAG: capsule biosynthesis protein CapI [Bacteroides sp. SM23_62_1]
MKVLVTGTAGFIGFHLARFLLENGYDVYGIDNINEYYDISLKYSRLEESGIKKELIEYGKEVISQRYPLYRFMKVGLEDQENIYKLFEKQKFDYVIHLAAQAGVRYSLIHPHTYIQSNISGFMNILEACRHNPVTHLIFASSSSVYGMNEQFPFSVKQNVDHPISLYAASKKSNELMAHVYSHLFGIPVTGLRFFTVYGPWGRPDMALFIFTKSILAGEPIEVFNHGKMERDFTYVDDIVEGVGRMIDKPPAGLPHWNGIHPDPSSSSAPYRLYNIGNSKPVNLMEFIEAIEKALGRKAKMTFKPMQPGDVTRTWADTRDLLEEFNYCPSTPVQEGVEHFVNWYRSYYGV